MSQHDMNLANADGATFRADANNALQAIAECNSGGSAPSTTFAYQWWADTGNNLLKQRNAANSGWITILTLSTGAVANSVIGKHTLWIPAAAMRPTDSNGCASITDVETTSGRPDLHVLDFDTGADEHAQFGVCFPKSWNISTVTFQVWWCSTATDTDGVAWGLQGVGVADNQTADIAYGTAVVVTDDAQSAAEEVYVTAESSAVTIAQTPADDDMTFFRVFRDVSDANDDMAEDARLLGLKLFYTIDAGEDT